jgi:hypothetical protein
MKFLKKSYHSFFKFKSFRVKLMVTIFSVYFNKKFNMLHLFPLKKISS